MPGLGEPTGLSAGCGIVLAGIESRSPAGSQAGQGDRQPGLGWEGFRETIYRNRVTLGAILIIAIQVLWKANVLAHSYFQQDDFEFTARGLDHHLSLGYLFRIGAGQLTPGSWLVVWILVRVSTYDWGLFGGTMLVLQTLAGLAMLRALRTLVGDRPIILFPLAVCLFTPLTIANMAWFAAGISAIPLQIAIPMAVDAHVRYVRGGRARHAIAAGFWTLFGMAFYLKGGAVPLLLFALTSAFLVEGGWRKTMLKTIRRYWPAWAIYTALLAIQVAVYISRLHTSSVTPRVPHAPSDLSYFGLDLVTKTFVPGAFGGPWGWATFGAAPEPFADAPTGLMVAAWAAAVVVIGASLWFRRHAWRAWAILFGWLIVADVIPVAAGRIGLTGRLLGLQTRYVADAVPVLAICLALAFLPLLGERDAHRAVLPDNRLLPAVTGAALGVFLLGSIWSVNGFLEGLRANVARSYIATANAALKAMPQRTVILNQVVPATILNPVLAGSGGYSYESRIFDPLLRKLHKKIIWTSRPEGKIPKIMIFDTLGRLEQAVVVGPTSLRPQECHSPTVRGVKLPLSRTVPPRKSTMQIGYYANRDVIVDVFFAGHTSVVTLPRSNLTNVYLQVQGSGSSVRIKKLTPGRGACIGSVTIGVFQPGPFVVPIPAAPRHG